jgi:hypothetical protein
MEDVHLTLDLKISEINVILAALQEIPAKIANPLTENIRKQATDQLQPAPEETAE